MWCTFVYCIYGSAYLDREASHPPRKMVVGNSGTYLCMQLELLFTIIYIYQVSKDATDGHSFMSKLTIMIC